MGGVRACLSCVSEFLHKLSCQLYRLINTTSVITNNMMEAKYEELEFSR